LSTTSIITKNNKLCFILPDRNPLKELKMLEPVSTIIELVKNIKFGKSHFIAPTFLLDFQKNPGEHKFFAIYFLNG
jgi:hypothetical protein